MESVVEEVQEHGSGGRVPYGREYFESRCGPIPYARNEPHWLSFFSGIAEQIISSLAPKRVLDAGCAMGFLVEALRDRGVEAHGLDVSEYAISRVRQDMAPYCYVATLSEPIPGRFDLITCMEVLEHLTEEQARKAILNMRNATDTILFSSTPSDFDEATHVNVRPIVWWLKLFAEFNLGPDILFDARFLAPHAMLFRRCPSRPNDNALAAFADSMQQHVETHKLKVQLEELQHHARALETRLDQLQWQAAAQQETAQADLRRKKDALLRELGEIRSNHAPLERITQRMGDLLSDLTVRYGQTCDTVKAQSLELGELRALQRELGVRLRELDARQTHAGLAKARLQTDVSRIYNSRIWRTLVSAGSLLERLPGLRPGPVAPANGALSGDQPALGGGQAMAAPLPVERMGVTIDTPVTSKTVFRGASLRVQGWAVAQSGIQKVLIWLDEDGPYEALYGFPRADVQSDYTGFNHSSHSGFIWCSPTATLNPGNHSIRVRGVSKAGHTTDIAASFLLDVQSEYEVWADLNTPTVEELAHMRGESGGWNYQPTISIVTPVYRTSEEYLRKCVDSVQRQCYGNWELILVDDASGDARLTALMESYAAADERIKLRELPDNAGIAGATNAGLELCTGQYVAFLDHDDEISADALYHIVQTLNEDPSLDMLYSDQDKIDGLGRRTNCLFKPDWSPDLLRSANYVSHFLVCRRELLEAIRGLRLGFDGSQDYDLVLRISERTGRIRRIPKVLYHWRMHPQSAALRVDAKPASSDAGRRALNDHLLRTGVTGEAQETEFNGYLIRYKISGKPEIGIVIPTGGSVKLRTALETVLRASTYPNYHVVVVDNSSEGDVREWVEEFQGGRHKVEWLDCRNIPFNFSQLCNLGAARTTSPYLLFLNDDTSVITPDWLEALLEHAQRKQVGAVGCMLLFPNGAIQHTGVVMGLFGVAGHPFRTLDERKGPYYFSLSHVIRNCAAVTGACLLTRREVFEEVGGFDEKNLPTCFQDVDYCLKLGERGYWIVYTPHARLYHHESATKTVVARLPEIAYMHSRWQSIIDNDPFYNPNLSRKSDCYDLDISGLLDRQASGAR